MTGTIKPAQPGQFQEGDRVRLKKGSPDLEVLESRGDRVRIRWVDGNSIWIDARELELGTRVSGITSEQWQELRWRTMSRDARRVWRMYALAVMDQGETNADVIIARATDMFERETRLFGDL